MSSLPTQLIYHPGRTDLPWKYPFFACTQKLALIRLNTVAVCKWKQDTWASPLSVAEPRHYSQQSLRGNSAHAFGWTMSLLHWFLPHRPFSAHAGMVWLVGLGLSPLAQCCILGGAAHHLWHQQKCVAQMNYPECYILSPEIVHSSHPCQLQMYDRGGRGSLCYPLPLPWACGSCLTLPVGSTKDKRPWDMPQQAAKISFFSKHALWGKKAWFSSPPWSNILATRGMRWKWAWETGTECLIDLLHQNLSFQIFSLFFGFFFFVLPAKG